MKNSLQVDLGKTGEDSLMRFIKTIRRLILLDKKKFDLIVGAGDSGQTMVYLTRLVYELLKIDCPQILVAPIYRHADESEKILFDNTTLAKDFQSVILSKMKNILFVDDEIGSGNAASGMLDLLLILINRLDERIVYTIVAEDGGFDSSSMQRQNIIIEFIPTKKRVEGAFNAISYIIPEEYELPIKTALQDRIKDLNCKQVMNILLNLPNKEFNDGKPMFTFRLHDIAKNLIPNFSALQQKYQQHLWRQVKSLII